MLRHLFWHLRFDTLNLSHPKSLATLVKSGSWASPLQLPVYARNKQEHREDPTYY